MPAGEGAADMIVLGRQRVSVRLDLAHTGVAGRVGSSRTAVVFEAIAYGQQSSVLPAPARHVCIGWSVTCNGLRSASNIRRQGIRIECFVVRHQACRTYLAGVRPMISDIV